MTSHVLRRLAPTAALAVALVAGLVATAPSTAAAVAPLDPTFRSAAGTSGGPTFTARERGFDVSYPQCGSVLPTAADFAVVGVDGGRPFDVNACLADQVAWAHQFGRPAYYVNSANPGPKLSDHWPIGQRKPQVCSRAKPDSAACAFDYGVNAAKDAFARARAAALSVGAPDVRRSTWWLDVETHNTWESLEYGERPKYLRNDTAVLAGMTRALHRRGVDVVGVYSSRHQWDRITGGASLDRAPVWYAGVGSAATARSRCTPAWSFTGGRVRMTQFLAPSGVDGDLRC
jgi:hypothetical protein